MNWQPAWYRNIWAPWRMEYIRNATKIKEEGCIFCKALTTKEKESLVLCKGNTAFIILNRFPYNPGHLMIAPLRHVSSLEDLEKDELSEIGVLIKIAILSLKKAYRPEGFNIGVNIGEVAGAGVPGHVHVHVVPRWNGDSNYMTVIGGAKVIPQSLEESYNLLKPIILEVAKGYELCK
ncbi:MAG: HIT domain-containing protein [Caldisphaeraceae archaeon]|nr:HIT domain-containing protein [Caldisphaeraceae archaeon]MEB3691656.1 HIT domain-containing protein [Caldisphaeraceae archaeon]MEB3798044.1 HIT domain-containing protein [Caldisphaeraceae archaeon]